MKKYKIQTLNGDIEFKLLSAEDTDSYYQTLLKDDNPYLEEYIFNIITDNKYQLDDLTAGIIPSVVYLSIKLSGIIKGRLDFLDTIDNTRKSQEINSYYSIYAKIIQVMPAYTLESMKSKTLNELMELYIFAETVSGTRFNDTKKAREVLAREEAEKSSGTHHKKGIKNLTKLDLDAIKNAINYNDSSNMI